MTKGRASSRARRGAHYETKCLPRSGLSAIDKPDILRVVEDRHALKIVMKLNADLTKLNNQFQPPSRTKQNKPSKAFKSASRSDVLRLLVILRRTVSGLTDDFSRPDIHCLSASTTLLNSLIAQLNELKHGIVGSIVRPTEGLGGAVTKYEEYRIREMALVMIRFKKKQKGSLKGAFHEVSALLEGQDIKYRNRSITSEVLRGWWHNSSALKKSK